MFHHKESTNRPPQTAGPTVNEVQSALSVINCRGVGVEVEGEQGGR